MLRSLLLKAPELYEDRLKQHPNTPDAEKLCFQNPGWISSRKGFGVSLYLPNKRLSTSKPDCVISMVDYLKNIWSIHHYLLEQFGVDPPIINGDQMPLRQNESSKQATSAFKNLQTFIKENKNLSEERRLLLMKASNYYSTRIYF